MRVTFEVEPGELLGIVSTFGRSVGRVIEPVAQEIVDALQRPKVKRTKKGVR